MLKSLRVERGNVRKGGGLLFFFGPCSKDLATSLECRVTHKENKDKQLNKLTCLGSELSSPRATSDLNILNLKGQSVPLYLSDSWFCFLRKPLKGGLSYRDKEGKYAHNSAFLCTPGSSEDDSWTWLVSNFANHFDQPLVLANCPPHRTLNILSSEKTYQPISTSVTKAFFPCALLGG